MKFAYLICAHDNFLLLKKLIAALDDPDNDLYIHIDEKAGIINEQSFLQCARHSKVCFLSDRVSVIWGHITLTLITLKLLEAALENAEYDYFHLISGVDFPLKKNEYIQSFFLQNSGKEFVGFSPDTPSLQYKLGYYHLINMNSQRKYSILKYVNRLSIYFQKILHIQNCTNIPSYYRKGCNWWSITCGLAREILNHQHEILRKYRYTSCSDEIFVQTYIHNSSYQNRVYSYNEEYLGCMRYIDWERGTPYVWKETDFEELKKSPYLFARKFSENHIEIINKLSDFIKKDE